MSADRAPGGQDVMPERARPTDRLFFALFPDAATAHRLATLAQSLGQRHGMRGKPLRTERLHVTLHHLGDHAGLAPELVAAACKAAAKVGASAFEVIFDRAETFPGKARKRPFVLRGGTGLAPLMHFQGELGRAMRESGLERFVQAVYTTHLTLLYDDRFIIDRAFPSVSWTVREFVLVQSLLGQTRYLELARFPLSG